MAQIYEVKSFTDPTKTYKVVRNKGSWTCSCESNFFRHVKCEHIRKVQHLKLKTHGRASKKHLLDITTKGDTIKLSKQKGTLPRV
jgi:hypothetical protein